MKKMLLAVAIICLVSQQASIAQTVSVGQVNIQPSVGQLGNAQLNMPIYCPPGRLGIKPNLSVNYNSMQGNGALGLGYTLAGTSSISRSGRNFHLNNEEQEAITLTSNDKLTLDGERLILVNGSYFSSGSTYRTENDKFMRVTFNGSSFIADLKDGGKLFYGSSSDSKLLPLNNNGEVLAWYLTYSYDKLGNYIQYLYDNSNGEINLTEVRYSGYDCTFNNTISCGTTKEAPYNRVELQYINTNYNDAAFIAGLEVKRTKVISTIETFANNTRVRLYEFTYNQTATHAMLTSIKEKNNLGESLPQVTLNWSEDGDEVIDRGVRNTSLTTYKTVGDFDGDGAKELLEINGELDPFNIKFLTPSDFFQILKYKQKNDLNSTGFFQHRLANPTLPTGQISGIAVADIDFDGDDDILFQMIDEVVKSYDQGGNWWCGEYDMHRLTSIRYKYHVLISSRADNGSYQFAMALNYFPERTFTHPEAFMHLTEEAQLYQYLCVTPYLADVDGDGLPDLILRQMNGKRVTIDDCNGHIRETAVEVANNNVFHIRLSTRRHLTNEADKYVVTHAIPQMNFQLIDFNGNGKVDLFNVMKWNNTSEVLEFDNANGSFKHIYGTPPQAQGFPTYDHHNWLKTGDFNGDGNTDLLYYTSNNWRVAYSNGVGFVEYNATQLWFQHNFNPDYCSSGSSYGFHLEVGDFNGDGKADILERHNHVHHSNSNHSGDDVHVYYSIGIGFSKTHIGQNPKTTTGDRYYDTNNILADFDGDSKQDVLLFHAGPYTSISYRYAAVQKILKKTTP